MFIAFLFSASIGLSQDLHSQVIYGQDDRLDLYEVTDPQLRALADSTVALIRNDRLVEQADSWKILSLSYREEQELCSEERFAEQYIAARCTGFLVAPNKIATAGHCASTVTDCLSQKFVFGYGLHMQGENITEVSKSEVYSCTRVIGASADPSGLDYSIVELDRPVPNHQPLKLNLTGNIAAQTPLFVIGHPAGLPTKVAGGARVRTSDDISFLSDLDTYGGNSGSPVFNAETLEVEGILVRGEWDYEYNADNTCKLSKVCPDGTCSGETSTKVSSLKDYLDPVSPIQQVLAAVH